MIEQVINKIGKAKFRVYWSDLDNSEIIMDFNPIIRVNNLAGSYLLLHWQAKPFAYRRWGIYDSNTDQYHAFDWDKVEFPSPLHIQTLQIPEAKWKVKPTAVILLKDTLLNNQQDRILIEPLR